MAQPEPNWRERGANAYRNSMAGITGDTLRLKITRAIDGTKGTITGFHRDPLKIYEKLVEFGDGIKEAGNMEAPKYVDEALEKYKPPKLPETPSTSQPGQPSP